MHKTMAAALLASAASAACSSTPGDTCSRDDQCASHFCRADGTCAPDVDGNPGGADAPPGGNPDAPLGCQPNHDGTITRAELPLAAGQHADFRIATNATVDTAGQLQPDGTHAWTLAAALSGDATDPVALESPQGAWWAADFPTASYATLLSTSQPDLRGVFLVDDAGLHLLGVVSTSGGTTRTELTYDPPVDVLRLPLTTTSAWTSQSTVSGLAQGVAAYYSESYDTKVDAVGTLVTPYDTAHPFPVVRVAVDFSQQVGTLLTTHKTFAFVSECYGTVATITSQDYETKTDFTKAAEVWRLAP